MKKVLLSIKPEFADKIFNGTKKYEFRRSIFKENIKIIVVYVSYPVQEIVGEFEVENILTGKVNKIWNMTKKFSGITKQYYDEYFENKDEANAICIGRLKKYRKNKLLSDFGIDFPPQSFMYI